MVGSANAGGGAVWRLIREPLARLAPLPASSSTRHPPDSSREQLPTRPASPSPGAAPAVVGHRSTAMAALLLPGNEDERR